MNRKLWLVTMCHTLLCVGAVICFTSGCGKSTETRSASNTAPAVAHVAATPGPDGHWEAEISGEGAQRVGISLDVAKNANSAWIASMGVPSQKMTGMVVKDVAVNGQSVKFVAVELMMAPFDLTLGSDGTMKGTISGRGAQPVEFKRTGEAKVQLIPPSPAVSKELEGDWETSVGPPNGGVRLVFHFKNQSDHKVAATMDSNVGADLPLNDVKQTGSKVEFGMKIGGASFQGTLNKEGTELVGKMTHDTDSIPMTLRKK